MEALAAFTWIFCIVVAAVAALITASKVSESNTDGIMKESPLGPALITFVVTLMAALFCMSLLGELLFSPPHAPPLPPPNPALQPTVSPPAPLPSQAPPARRG